LIDYHLHTKRCGHAVGEMREYVRSSIEKGLQEIGFADHLPLLHTFDPTLTMSWDDFPFYVADVMKMKEEFKEIKIRFGVEVDYIPGKVKELQAIIDEYDFDYVLGSVHFIDSWGFDDRRFIDNYDNYNIDDLYKRYFKEIADSAKTKLFDIIAHPDLIKKYGFKPTAKLEDVYKKTIDAIKDSGVAIEISSAGLRKPVKEIYPSQEFIDICYKEGIPIVTGSDAHSPQDVGRDFDKLVESLKLAGYTEVATYVARERIMTGLKERV